MRALKLQVRDRAVTSRPCRAVLQLFTKKLGPPLFMSKYGGGGGGGGALLPATLAAVPTARKDKFTVKEVYYQSDPF
jgi:hypothetical protein